MKVAALIVEYNPLHNGHVWQIEQARKLVGKDGAVVAIMSGNFCQRGSLSCLDKFTKAELAIQAGVDLVIELPALAALASADNFGRAAVSIINALGICDYVVAGTETENYKLLHLLAAMLHKFIPLPGLTTLSEPLPAVTAHSEPKSIPYVARDTGSSHPDADTEAGNDLQTAENEQLAADAQQIYQSFHSALKSGLSYPQALSTALSSETALAYIGSRLSGTSDADAMETAYTKEQLQAEVLSILQGANNILALSYLKGRYDCALSLAKDPDENKKVNAYENGEYRNDEGGERNSNVNVVCLNDGGGERNNDGAATCDRDDSAAQLARRKNWKFRFFSRQQGENFLPAHRLRAIIRDNYERQHDLFRELAPYLPAASLHAVLQAARNKSLLTDEKLLHSYLLNWSSHSTLKGNDLPAGDLWQRLDLELKHNLTSYLVKNTETGIHESCDSTEACGASLDKLLQNISHKSLTKSHIRRTLTRELLRFPHLDNELMNKLTCKIPYLRILAANRKKGRYLLKLMRKTASAPLITRVSDFYQKQTYVTDRDTFMLFADCDKKAGNFYTILSNNPDAADQNQYK